MARRCIAIAAAAASACADAAYVELQIADATLPFLREGADYDELGVEARAKGCADVSMRYGPAPLPATLSISPGACYAERADLRAAAYLAERRVAESAWIEAVFPEEGPLVLTATLADLPGRRVLFETGYEPGEPLGDRTAGLDVVLAGGIDGLVAKVSEAQPITGLRSAFLSGVATSTGAHALARVGAVNVLVSRGDELVFTLEPGTDTEVLAIGVDLELGTGATAKSLGLTDQGGRAIDPSSAEGRAPGLRQRFTVDLSAAAGARLVGVLFGADVRGTGGTGRVSARLDDLSIVRP